MSAEHHDFGGAKPTSIRNVGHDPSAKSRVGRQQAEGDKGMSFPTAHRLRKVICSCVAFAGQPFEAGGDEPMQTVGEMAPTKEGITIDLALLQLLKAGDLVAEAVPNDLSAGRTQCFET